MKENFIVLRSYENGRVVKAAEKESGRKVAVKRWEKAEDLHGLGKREQKILPMLHHSAIPKFVYTFEDEKYSYMVSEWIEGETLETYVSRTGPLTIGEAGQIAKKVYRILCYLHSHPQGPFIYGDLKPSNVLIANEAVYLVDFESVKTLTASGKSSQMEPEEKTVVMGTACFTAPEVFWGKECCESDFYSLGALYYYMITGAYWQGELPENGDGRICKMLRHLLEVSPEKRKQGIKILLEKEAAQQVYDTNLMPVAIAEKKPVMPSFRRQIIFVEDNYCFGAELACEAVRHFRLRVGVFAVSVTGVAAIKRYLKENNRNPENTPIFEDEVGEDLFRKKRSFWLENGYLQQSVAEALYYAEKPLEMYCGNACDSVSSFTEWATRNFDVTIILGTGHSENTIGKYLMKKSDYVIAAPEANLVEAVCSANYFGETLKKGLAYSVKYVAWEFKKGISLPVDGFAKIVGKDNFLGPIMYDGERLICENMKKENYCKKMPEQVRRQYYSVMVSLWGRLEEGWERLQ